MTTHESSNRVTADDRAARRFNIQTWGAVGAALVGAFCIMLAVISLDFNHTLSLVLVCVGVPLILLGGGTLAWLNRRH